MSDTLIIGGTTYNNVAGFKATGNGDNTVTFVRPTGTKQINENGTGIDVSAFAAIDVNVQGGGTIGKIINHVEFTPASNIDSSNPATINLTKNVNCVVLVVIQEYPSSQDPTLYIPIIWSRSTMTGATTGGTGFWLALRPSSESGLGTDRTMCTFTKTTGVLSLGGEYGTFEAGRTWDIYQIEID